MHRQKNLIQWIGYSDLRALAAYRPPALSDKIMDEIGGTLAKAGDRGSTKTLLDKQRTTCTTPSSNVPLKGSSNLADYSSPQLPNPPRQEPEGV